MEDGLADAIIELKRRRDVRIVVLKANGRMFCAGGDPKTFFEEVSTMTETQNKEELGNSSLAVVLPPCKMLVSVPRKSSMTAVRRRQWALLSGTWPGPLLPSGFL